MLLAEPVERVARDPVFFAHFVDGRPFFKLLDDDATVLLQYLHLRTAALAPSEFHPLRLAQSQCFTRTHGNEIALNLRHQTEGETQNLAVDGVVELMSLLDAVKTDVLPQTPSHDFHDVGERAAQPRNLGDDERVTLFHPVQQITQLAVVAVLASTDDFRHPLVDIQLFATGETQDLLPLVVEVLLPCTDS